MAFDDIDLKKKDAQYGSCELSFIWAKMRTAAWEIAPLIAASGEAAPKREGEKTVY